MRFGLTRLALFGCIVALLVWYAHLEAGGPKQVVLTLTSVTPGTLTVSTTAPQVVTISGSLVFPLSVYVTDPTGRRRQAQVVTATTATIQLTLLLDTPGPWLIRTSTRGGITSNALTFTVYPTAPPLTLNCPATATAVNTNPAPVSYGCTISGGIPPYSGPTYELIPQSIFAVGGPFPVLVTASDQVRTVTATIQVNVVSNPGTLSISCPTSLFLTSTDGNPVVGTYPPPSTTGGTLPIATSESPASGTQFPVGTTSILGFASDSSSPQLTAQCNFTVTVTFVNQSGLVVTGPDPTEPLLVQPNTTVARVKTPQQQMHYTANTPIRFMADAGGEPNIFQCPPGHPPYQCPDAKVDFYVDGTKVGTMNQSDAGYVVNGYEYDITGGLAAGDHILSVIYTPHASNNLGGTPVNGFVPVTIHVDPPRNHANLVTLSADLVLSGSTALNWTDTTVIGNGHKVSCSGSCTGSITIVNSDLRGLGVSGNYSVDVTTTGAVDMETTVVENSAPVRLNISGGSANLAVLNNELRSNMLVLYGLNNPSLSPSLDLTDTSSGTKTVKGNRIGGGILSVSGGSNWQIGGMNPTDGNVLIGPRAVLVLNGITNSNVQGNYDHHDYNGLWSQGFVFEGTNTNPGLLVEHNVIRGSSWPVQSIGGEFRYNLVIDDQGHDSWRTMPSSVLIHHNIFDYIGFPNSEYDGMLMTYQGESSQQIYNNTFDTAGAQSAYNGPAVTFGASSIGSRVNSNLIRNFSDVNSNYTGTINGQAGGLTASDYNAFWNPLVTTTPHYAPGLITGAHGTHDVTANPALKSTVGDTPYLVDEGLIWTGQLTSWTVLGYYRQQYTPQVGSPLIDAGDPNEGAGNDIGAIGAGTPNTLDLFGTFNVNTVSTGIVHPAIWLSPTVLTALKAKVANSDANWLSIKSDADAYLTATIMPYSQAGCSPPTQICFDFEGSGWGSALSELGMAYQMTGNTAYATKAIAVMQFINQQGITPITVDHGYTTRNTVVGMALAYDWVYPLLDATTKANTIATMNAYYDDAKTDPNIFDPLPTCSASGNYCGGHILGFGLFGLATAGDNSRSTEISNYISNIWSTTIAQAVNGGIFTSGYPYEAYGYGAGHFVRLLEYANGVQTATGQNVGSSLAQKIAHSMVYSEKPNRWQFPDEGDYPGNTVGIMDPTILYMLSDIAPGTTDAAYAQWLVNHLATPPDNSTAAPFNKFLWLNASAPATTTSVLPNAWYSPGDEHEFTRTDWTDTAIWTSFRMTSVHPTNIDHELRGAGNVEIQRGSDYLLVNSDQWKGSTGVMGNPQTFLLRSLGTNTLDYLSNFTPTDSYGGGQGIWGNNNTLAHAETSTYGWICADLTTAYTFGPSGAGAGPAPNLQQFRRCSASLLDGNVVVFDHIVAGSASDLHAILWHINQASSTPTISGQTVTATVGGSTLFMKVMNPAASIALSRDTVSDEDPTQTTYRITVADTSGTTTFDVITVLSTYASAGSPPTITSAGALAVQIGGKTVTFGAGATSVTVGSGAISYTDNFTRADSGTLGANWTDIVAGLHISGNKAVATGTFTPDVAYYSAASFAATQTSDITVQGNQARYYGTCARLTGTSSANMDGYCASLDSITGAIYLDRVDNGTFTVLWSEVATYTDLQNGDVLRVHASGSTLQVFVSYAGGAFQQIHTDFTDTTYATGQPGILLNNDTNTPTISNWAGKSGS